LADLWWISPSNNHFLVEWRRKRTLHYLGADLKTTAQLLFAKGRRASLAVFFLCSRNRKGCFWVIWLGNHETEPPLRGGMRKRDVVPLYSKSPSSHHAHAKGVPQHHGGASAEMWRNHRTIFFLLSPSQFSQVVGEWQILIPDWPYFPLSFRGTAFHYHTMII